jgi:hypothetical protein
VDGVAAVRATAAMVAALRAVTRGADWVPCICRSDPLSIATLLAETLGRFEGKT